MLVGAVAITVVFAAGVAGWRFVRGDDAGVSREGVPWSAVAFVNRATGGITRVGPDGDTVGTSPASGRVSAVFADRGVVALANSEQLTIPADDAGGTPLTIDIARGQSITPIATGGGLYLAVGSEAGGDVVLVNVAERSVIDIGELVTALLPTTPRMFVDTLRVNADGTMFAIADVAGGQTIVIRPGDPTPVFLADQPVAVGAELVATSQTVGLQADVALVDLDRSAKATVATEIPAGGYGVMHGDLLTMVSIDGGIYRVEPDDTAATRVGAVVVPAGGAILWVRATADGQRLVVAGSTFEALVDLDGRTLFTTTFSTAVDVLMPEFGWSCLPVGGDGGYHSIVRVDTGEQVADLTGTTVVDVSDDGCTVLADRAGSIELIAEGGVTAIGKATEAVLSPDGQVVAQVLSDGTVQLLPIDGDGTPGEPVDVTATAGRNPIIAFVPD